MNTSSIYKAYSYAKINLGLHILRRLESGYHEIETGFVFLEWADEIKMQLAKKTQISFGDSELSSDENTLVHKAINALKKAGYSVPELHIEVNKRIPLGAGLGGGSSNAAVTLRMINHIAALNISEEELLKIGATLGADVPIFIKGKPCFATGTGTTLKTAAIQPECWILTVFPKESSSTVEAYQNCMPNDEKDIDLLAELELKEVEEWNYLIENDLEKSVIPFHPIIGDFKDQMYDFGAVYAAMSGSGSSVFGLFEQDFVALAAYEAFLSLGYPCNLTRPNFKPDTSIFTLI